MPDNATGHVIFMARLRATMAWSASTLLQLRAFGSKPYLSGDEVRESTFLGGLFLDSFQRLAAFYAHAGKLLYHFKPKLHMLGHLLEFVASGAQNPESFSNWVDEDNMKWLAQIAASLKPKTATQQLSKQYILKRTLAWSRDAEKVCMLLATTCVVSPTP